ncbi:MAG: hypothetical protein A2293_15305 [Elusimicrobia bacterium RIFOXYB2_FULL_49_7]|nr:MAG: hypothetical protein A2293_15305 [Elusimicrobia bacterium RIFOXYB2_FULL_49_7]
MDERTDIYSLGIMFYEMLAGRNPFFDKRGYQQTIWNVLHGEVRRLREISDWIPRDVETIVMKCMEKDREKRYQTMRALRLDLERFQIGEPIMARSPNLFEKIARNVRKRRGVYLSMFIITFLLSLFFAYYYYQQSLEKADWDHIILKPGFYFNLDAEWNGRRGEAGELLKFLTMESPWVGSPDRIQVVSEDYTWISWKEEVRNDIRLDFTVQIERENSREFGCFIHGTNPDNGYSFRFQSGRVFLTKGSRNSIMDIADIPDFMAKEQLIIHVEKNDYLIRLSVNGETKILFNDYTPLSGTDNHSFGFYVDNAGIIVSDVALYNLGVPFKTKPIQTAERFFERSYYQDAIEEYRNIIRLYPSDPMAARARFKIGLAYVRMGDHEKAIAEFENILRFGSEELVPYAMGEIVNAYSALQKTAESRSTLLRLRDQFPKSASIIRILSDYNSQIIGLVKKGEPDSLYQAKEVLDFLVNDFRGYGPFFLPAYLAYGESFMDKGQFEKAASVFSAIDLRFSEKLETAVISKVRLADIEAFSGSTEKAQTAYNDILTRYHKNKPVCAEAWMGIAMINRVQGNAGDAIKCYNFVMDEFSMFRDLCAKSLLSAAMTYLEKEAPQELAYNLFKKLISHYRDCPGQVVVARFLTGEIDEAEFRQKGGAPLTDYYIAEKFRTQGNGIRALEQYQRFEKKIKGNRLLMRLAEKQIAYLRR